MWPELPALRFDPIGHRYWLGTRELPSVTQVLREAGLVQTAWNSDFARLRGTVLHRATERLDRGDRLPDLGASLEPYVAAYRDFVRDTHPVWQGVEQPVVDRALSYAGTLDRWGTLSGDLVVLELKTGTVVPSWTPLQLVAYGRLPLGEPTAARPRRLAVQLLPTGRYAIREYPIVNFSRDERVFLAALAVTQWKRGLYEHL